MIYTCLLFVLERVAFDFSPHPPAPIFGGEGETGVNSHAQPDYSVFLFIFNLPIFVKQLFVILPLESGILFSVHLIKTVNNRESGLCRSCPRNCNREDRYLLRHYRFIDGKTYR